MIHRLMFGQLEFYELLHGYSPFGNSENINEIFQNIIINKYS